MKKQFLSIILFLSLISPIFKSETVNDKTFSILMGSPLYVASFCCLKKYFKGSYRGDITPLLDGTVGVITLLLGALASSLTYGAIISANSSK